MNLMNLASNKSVEEVTKENGNTIVKVIKGSVLAIALTAIFLSSYAAILSFTNISETTIVPVVIVLTGISLLIGSSISTIPIKKQGMLNGGLVGLIYMLVLYIISSIILGNFGLNINSIIMIAVGVLTGMVGGIIGVNIHK